jgi:hypothetical protein
LPRFGYCLAAGDRIVGVLLQIYSVRRLAGGEQTLCHLSSWCVDVSYRAMAPVLSIAATRRRDVTYINISPAAHTRRGIAAMGFERYSRGQMIFAPILSRRRTGARIVAWTPDSAATRSLPESEREILAHHVGFGCRAFIGVLDGAAYGFVTATTSALRGRVPCERVIYCRDTEVLATFAGAIGAHLAGRAALLCIVDANDRIDGLAGRFVADREPKYFKGPTRPALGDLAYSELALLNGDAMEPDVGDNFWLRFYHASRQRLLGTEPSANARAPTSEEDRPGENASTRGGPGAVLDFQRRGTMERRLERGRAAGAAAAAEVLAAPAILLRRPRVRSLSARDLAQVAAMFRKGDRRDCGSASLSSDLEAVFLGHPHYDEATCALVYERDDGVIGAFLGCLPLRASFLGSRQLGSVMSACMVGDRLRDPRAGVLLVRSHLEREHPFTLAGAANGAFLEFAALFKISVLAAHSLQWIKPVNYCGYAMSSLGGSRALTRIARGPESLFRRLTGKRSGDGFGGWRSRVVDAEAFAARFLSLVQDYRLHPDWSLDFLQWLLRKCGRRTSLGRLRLCEVADPKGVVVGCYAYHRMSEARAVVLQILTRRNAEAGVLHALIADAEAENCVAVCGSANQRLLEGLFQIPNVFYRHTCSTGVKARQPDLLEAFLAGHALVGGLVGDGWMPLASEPYD